MTHVYVGSLPDDAEEATMTDKVADTGLNQMEMGVCVGAWVGIFALFSFVDVTETFLVQWIFTLLFWVADKLPTLISVAILCVALYFAFIKRTMLVSGLLSGIKKLTRRR